MNKKQQLFGAAVVVFSIAILLLSVYMQNAPHGSADMSGEGGFSIENIFGHIQSVAAAPRPVGTENHARARKYLEENLTKLGITPEIQRSIAFNSRSAPPFRAGYVTNVVGRIKGTGGGNTILLVAHYDSVSTGIGAADDASSVAAILETLRILKSESPGANDVAVLFSDAEEIGSLGAKAFAAETTWIGDVKAVINLEARGTSGASLLFETSDANARLIKAYSASAVYPNASSFFSDVYKILPNDTDLTEFKLKGIEGLNTAFIEDINNYHTAADNLSNLDKNSVRQHGENLLAVVRNLRNADLSQDDNGSQVFFDLFGKTVIHYPIGMVLPLMILAIILYCAAVYFGRKAGKINIKGLIIGFLFFLFFLFAEIIMSVVVVNLIAAFHKNYKMFLTGDTYNSNYYVYGMMCLAFALAFVFYVFFGKNRTSDEMFFGAVTFWVFLSILTSLLLPGTSYVFTLSAISISIACLIVYLLKNGDSFEWKNVLIMASGSLTGIILVGGIIRHLIEGLGVGLLTVGIVFIALTIGLLIYALLMFERKTRLMTGALFAAAGLVLIISGLASVSYSPEKPRQTSVFWAFNADTNKAFWATEDADPNEWNKPIFEGNATDKQLPEIFPQSQRVFLVKETQAADLKLPILEKIADETSGDTRRITLKTASANQSPVITLAVESNAEITGFEIDGKSFSGEISDPSKQKSPWAVRLYGVPLSGATVVLQVKTAEPLKIRAITQDFGFPPSADINISSRPPDLIANLMPFNDSTFISKLFEF